MEKHNTDQPYFTIMPHKSRKLIISIAKLNAAKAYKSKIVTEVTPYKRYFTRRKTIYQELLLAQNRW